jgi:peptidoglycan/xylan/chitin deacetylase (PgdA/CDA1 family)
VGVFDVKNFRIGLMALSMAGLGLGGTASSAEPPPSSSAAKTFDAAAAGQPGTQMSDAQLLAIVAPTRTGKKLTPKTWPNHARVAVALSFDVDNESYMLAGGERSPTTLSAGDYGAQSGLPRIIKLIDKYQIPTTFFIPAVSAVLHPEQIPSILKSGRNEIGVHGWIHESVVKLPASEEERLMDQAIDYLTKASGKRPVGYRAPGWAFSQNTLALLQKKGFVYDSSLQAMDEPYSIVSNGKDTGLIELAIDWTMTESVFLGPFGSLPSPKLLFQNFEDEFDGAYEEGTLFVLTLHPHIAGHRAPMKYLEELIKHMKSKPGVWFATGSQIAEYVAKAEKRDEPAKP